MKNSPTVRPKRYFVQVDASVLRGFEMIRKALGKPNKITLASAALKHVIERVNEREIVLTNGEFEQAQQPAQHKAA